MTLLREINLKGGVLNFWTHQLELIQELKNNRYVVVKKPRQAGFTSVAMELSALAARDGKEVSFFVPFQKTFVAKDFVAKYGNLNLFSVYNYGETTIKRSDLIIMDEVAYGRPDKVELSWWSAIAHHTPDARVLIGSTPGPITNQDGKDNFFYEIWNRENVFSKLEWSVEEHPVLRNKDFSHLTEAQFNIEVKAEFIARARDRQVAIDVDMRDDGNYVMKLRPSARFSVSNGSNGPIVQVILSQNQLGDLLEQIKDFK